MFTFKPSSLLLGGVLAWLLVSCATTATPFPTPPPLDVPSPPPISNNNNNTGGGGTAATTPTPADGGQEGQATAEAIPPTAEPTFTPVVPTVAATPATNPAVQAASNGSLPPISQNAYFLAGGNLSRWATGTGQIQTVIGSGDLTHLAISPDGQRAAVVRRIVLAEERELDEALGFEKLLRYEQSQILFLDLISGEQWVIVPRADNVQSVAIAPDAQRVAFVASGLGGDESPRTAEDTLQTIFVLTTGGGSGPSAPQAVGDCAVGCFSLLWNNENNLLVWADHAALWLFNTASSQPETLLAHRYNETDILWYWPVAWAQNGRFLLLNEYQFENQATAVLDVPTRQLVPLPESGNFISPYPTHVQWMVDDRLLVGRSNPAPTVELWRVDVDNQRINREEALVVGTAEQGLLGTRHLADGRFAFALSDGNAAVAGTYLLTSLSETPVRVNGIPPISQQAIGDVPVVWWDGNGTGAMVRMGTAVYYAPADGMALYDLSPLVGEGTVEVVWR